LIMTDKPEVDAVSGVETTGHSWDGLRELNNPLPKWWLYILYVCIAWSVGYWFFYPAWPLYSVNTVGLLGWSARGELAEHMNDVRQSKAVMFQRIAATPLAEVAREPVLLEFALKSGAAAFGQNCAPCHGAGGQGNVGYPRLVDDDWLWGGSVDAIYQTIQHGIRATDDADTRVSDMPRFGADGLLTTAQIDDVAEYVLSLNGRTGNAGAAQRGDALFAENCVACHGERGIGNPEVGAPRLSDSIWLYGGDKATLIKTITYARRGVMPAWVKRFDDPTLKTLAVYVHELGGGT